jgi:hypothetical protein
MLYKDLFVNPQKDFQSKESYMFFKQGYWTLEFDSIETYRFVEKKSDFGKTEYELHIQLPSIEEWQKWCVMEDHWEQLMKPYITSNPKATKKETIFLSRMSQREEPGWIRIRLPRNQNHWFQCSHMEIDGVKQEYLHMNALFQYPWKRIQLSLEWKGYMDWKKLLENRWISLQWKVLSFSGNVKALE